MLIALAAAVAVAAVVIVEARAWEKPPDTISVFTVTLRVDTSGFDEAVRRAAAQAGANAAAWEAHMDRIRDAISADVPTVDEVLTALDVAMLDSPTRGRVDVSNIEDPDPVWYPTTPEEPTP
jgi:hypothetical protein